MSTTSLEVRPQSDLPVAVVLVAVALGVGLIGGLATVESIDTWYAALNKPAFTPPNGVFAPVWTTLYVAMGIAAWRVWRTGHPARRPALLLYAVQLAFNLAWSLIFFGLQRPGLALIEVVPFLAIVVATGNAFGRIDRPAGVIFAVYAAWVAFASALNFEVWRLN